MSLNLKGRLGKKANLRCAKNIGNSKQHVFFHGGLDISNHFPMWKYVALVQLNPPTMYFNGMAMFQLQFQDSKWPVQPLVGGHQQSLKRVTEFHHPKKISSRIPRKLFYLKRQNSILIETNVFSFIWFLIRNVTVVMSLGCFSRAIHSLGVEHFAPETLPNPNFESWVPNSSFVPRFFQV